MKRVLSYYFLWGSEGAHRLLYRDIRRISRKLGKGISDELTFNELAQSLKLGDLRCISPPTLEERLHVWITGNFYKNVRYKTLRAVKMRLLNEKARRGEKLDEEEFSFAFHYGFYTSGESLQGPLKDEVEGIVLESMIQYMELVKTNISKTS